MDGRLGKEDIPLIDYLGASLLRKRLIDAIKITMLGKIKLASEIGIGHVTLINFLGGERPVKWTTLGKIKLWVEKIEKMEKL